MDNTQIQYEVRYKIFHLILEHAYQGINPMDLGSPWYDS